MRIIKKKIRGFILVVTLILSALFFLISIAFSSFIVGSNKASGKSELAKITLYIADAGLNYARSRMRQDQTINLPNVGDTKSYTNVEIYNDGTLRGCFDATIKYMGLLASPEHYLCTQTNTTYTLNYAYALKSIGYLKNLAGTVTYAKRTICLTMCTLSPCITSTYNPASPGNQLLIQKEWYEEYR